MAGTRHNWDYHGLEARHARNRTCRRCTAAGWRTGYGNVPWNTRWENGPQHFGEVPPCPGKPPEPEKAVQSPPPQVIDLRDVPGDVAWSAEILVPGGTVRVYAGMVHVRSGKRANVIEVESGLLREGWVTETREKTRGIEVTMREIG